MAVKTTKKQYSKLKDEILSLLEEVSLFENDSKEAQKERIEKSKKDFFYFFNTYFPHYAEEGTPDFHRDLIKEIEKKQEIIPVAAPRGFAKSTIVTFAYTMWEILKGHEGIITTSDSKIPCYVVPTNEEVMIARDTYDLVLGNNNV